MRPEAAVDLCFWSSRTGGEDFEFDYSTHYRGTARPEKYLVRKGHQIQEEAERPHNARKGWPRSPVSQTSSRSNRAHT